MNEKELNQKLVEEFDEYIQEALVVLKKALKK